MYNLEGQKLRVCASYLREERNRTTIRKSRIILLQHLLPTTEEFIYLLAEAGAEIYAVFGKPYSIDPGVLERLKARGYPIHLKSYEELESTSFLDDIITRALEQSQKDERKILVLEVGGYFAEPLKRLSEEQSRLFFGVVEDTTFGHNRYLQEIKSINIPIISVARSRLKEIEAHFVGRDAVQAVEAVLRKEGVSLTGRHGVVIGYGMIGKNVARALQANDLNVSVYDIRDHRNLKAFMMGCNVDKKAELLRRADIVFAATGWSTSLAVIDAGTGKPNRKPAVSGDEILTRLKNNALLVSVGSKDNEFDMRRLNELAINRPEEIGQYIEKYKLPNATNIFVIKKGTAVNFIQPSIPVEVLDLVFSEILLSAIFLIKFPENYPIGYLHSLPEKYWSYIAKEWLRLVVPKR